MNISKSDPRLVHAAIAYILPSWIPWPLATWLFVRYHEWPHWAQWLSVIGIFVMSIVGLVFLTCAIIGEDVPGWVVLLFPIFTAPAVLAFVWFLLEPVPPVKIRRQDLPISKRNNALIIGLVAALWPIAVGLAVHSSGRVWTPFAVLFALYLAALGIKRMLEMSKDWKLPISRWVLCFLAAACVTVPMGFYQLFFPEEEQTP